jgi:hypothetical protein
VTLICQYDYAFFLSFPTYFEGVSPVGFGTFSQSFCTVNSLFVKAQTSKIHLFFTFNSLIFYFFTYSDKLFQSISYTVTVLSKYGSRPSPPRLFYAEKFIIMTISVHFAHKKTATRG